MTAKIKTISYADFVATLLANLPERESEVLQKRNSLSDFPKHTLEQIGKDFNITRERVRQIEREGLRKLKTLDHSKLDLPSGDLESLIIDYLKSNGGAMAEWHLITNLLQDKEDSEAKALDFILTNLLSEKINRVPTTDKYNVVWHLENVDLSKILEISSALHDIINKHGSPLHVEDLSGKFKSNKHYSKVDSNEAETQKMIEALLGLNKNLNKNILNQWGQETWTTVRPKRMTDKAYLIMLKEDRPLHFAEVADLINQVNFDRKKAHPATVHNELILDDKYVLVGRGIYALKSWGYKEGTVADIIAEILKQGPMIKKDITEEVLKQRLVQKTTITLVLMNKDKFGRLEDGRYQKN